MGDLKVQRPRDEDEIREFNRAILADVRALERMLDDAEIFEPGLPRFGVEQEMYLVSASPPHRPEPVGVEILEAQDDPRVTSELARFNLEANLDPMPLRGGFLERLEEELRGVLAAIDGQARDLGARVLLAGILPTLRHRDLRHTNMTPELRYELLNDALRRLRGEHFHVFIRGLDLFEETFDSVMLEAANCSVQLHLQVDPQRFTRLYNLAQLISAPLLAAASNSPVLLGHRLWHETRVALFEASVDSRTETEVFRGIQPRVNFGTDWVRESILEIFRESALRFRVLLTQELSEDSLDVLRRGEVPRLAALSLHNGTIWRWNRPCYGVIEGRPHLRIENRVLPAGPTVVDEVANAGLFYGLMLEMGKEDLGIPMRLSFDDARANFINAARHGMDAQLTWLDGKKISAAELLRGELLDNAREGLRSVGCSSEEVGRYVDLVERRLDRRRSGSHWILDSLASDRDATRQQTLEAIAADTLEHQQRGEPVHEWPLASSGSGRPIAATRGTVRAIMSNQLLTVRPEDAVDLALSLMQWRHIRHVPVEDAQGRLVGLLSATSVLDLWDRQASGFRDTPIAVRDVMDPSPVSVDAETPLADAARTLLRTRQSCLLVTSEGRLAGIVTERDLLRAAMNVSHTADRDEAGERRVEKEA